MLESTEKLANALDYPVYKVGLIPCGETLVSMIVNYNIYFGYVQFFANARSRLRVALTREITLISANWRNLKQLGKDTREK